MAEADALTRCANRRNKKRIDKIDKQTEPYSPLRSGFLVQYDSLLFYS